MDMPDSRTRKSALEALLKVEMSLRIPSGYDIEAYLYERYHTDERRRLRRLYYALKPFVPRPVQIALRRRYASGLGNASFPAWPIETAVTDRVRAGLRALLRESGRERVRRIAPWPAGARFACALTHDVEQEDGLKAAPVIAAMERRLGFVSSWNLVPERYPIDGGIVENLRAAGFEIGVHGLKHDGRLFDSYGTFRRRAARINAYAAEWGAAGFRSPSTLRRVAWMPELAFEYDSSFPDTDPYEPQPGGCCTIWPYFIGHLVELPLTMPQDHTLFEILGHADLSAWVPKSEWIERQGGLVLINVHPDYTGSRARLRCYEEFLLRMKEKPGMWNALPRDIARWWRDRDGSSLEAGEDTWRVRGPASDRASVIETTLEEGSLRHITVPCAAGGREASPERRPGAISRTLVQ